MASLSGPVCFVLGGCETAKNRIQSTIIPPSPSSLLETTSSLHTSPVASSTPLLSTSSVALPSPPTLGHTEPLIPLHTSGVLPSPNIPAASTSPTPPMLHACHCTSTGTIVGITIAAASTASVFTMLVLLCLLRRNGRSASTKLARPTTDPFSKSKHPNPSPSSIRDTVILISPDREARRSSESHYSQDSHRRGTTGIHPKSGLRVSVPQLPAIDLSPSLLALSESPYSLESEYKSKYGASNLSPPPPPAPSRSYLYEGSGDVPSGGRMPSVIGGFAGSDRRVLPSMVVRDGSRSRDAGVDVKAKMKMKAKMSLDVNGAVPPKTLPVNAARTAALLPLHGRGR